MKFGTPQSITPADSEGGESTVRAHYNMHEKKKVCFIVHTIFSNQANTVEEFLRYR